MISPAAHDDEELLAERAVGAGMFEVVEYRSGDIIRYERFEDYWDPDAVGAAGFETHIGGSPGNYSDYHILWCGWRVTCGARGAGGR